MKQSMTERREGHHPGMIDERQMRAVFNDCPTAVYWQGQATAWGAELENRKKEIKRRQRSHGDSARCVSIRTRRRPSDPAKRLQSWCLRTSISPRPGFFCFCFVGRF